MDTGRIQGLAKGGQMHDHKYVCQPRESDMLANFKPFYLRSRESIRLFVAFPFCGMPFVFECAGKSPVLPQNHDVYVCTGIFLQFRPRCTSVCTWEQSGGLMSERPGTS